ncbi:hypothetical protein AAFZ98_004649 [Vibrio parahaemolyticus]|uniref:hypothetical protein n=1 Tax=Vibrio parahaemolyticus TaxID=670 RepID=UPI00046E62AB|nr:hypothetical protein [Vibrio parahaemolyticus]EMA2439029.1 hypothetical protein [Vibrio parahaemolyticus]MBE3867394.1 hypothetical protein [Vibrio parahaemolyticus]MDG3050371.1 hypothetical protein [Vibrio parahaemolyticus]
MEIANLVLKYIEALKWPFLIVFVLLLFRRTIVTLLEKLAEVSFGGENGFNMKLQAAKKVAEQSDKSTNKSAQTFSDSNLLLSLPDNTFVYLSSIANKALKDVYFPNSGDEFRHLVVLADFGIMKQRSMEQFEFTEVGRQLVNAIKTI